MGLVEESSRIIPFFLPQAATIDNLQTIPVSQTVLDGVEGHLYHGPMLHEVARDADVVFCYGLGNVQEVMGPSSHAARHVVGVVVIVQEPSGCLRGRVRPHLSTKQLHKAMWIWTDHHSTSVQEICWACGK